MESRMTKIFSKKESSIALKVYQGHFATPNSHITHYFDMTTLKTRASEAKAVAKVLANQYSSNTIVDTIVCIDGTEVIGAYLAEGLTDAGILSMNTHKTIYITTPETNASGQLMFRENCRMMIEKKNVLILMASATTGSTLKSAVDSVLYYGGRVSGVAAIFSNVSKIAGMDVYSIFNGQDVPGYQSHIPGKCPLCAAGVKIDALVNGYGYSKL